MKSRLFYINYKISLNIAWDQCPVLIKASLLCKHQSANLEALNKTSREAPRGWFSGTPSQDPRQLFPGIGDPPTGPGPRPRTRGWTEGARSGPCPLPTLGPPRSGFQFLPRDAVVLRMRERCSISLGHGETTLRQRPTDRKPHSTSPWAHKREPEPSQPRRSGHQPRPFPPGPSEKGVLSPSLPDRDTSYSQRKRPGSVLWNHWCMNYVAFISKARMLKSSETKSRACGQH